LEKPFRGTVKIALLPEPGVEERVMNPFIKVANWLTSAEIVAEERY
jgi:hypothetical protein